MVGSGRSRLGKAQVEALLAAASVPVEGVAAEIAAVQAALRPVLARLTGLRDGASWAEVIAAARLPEWRRALLLSEAPTPARLDALWALVTELNETRRLP
jgi:hypothetical protein